MHTHHALGVLNVGVDRTSGQIMYFLRSVQVHNDPMPGAVGTCKGKFVSIAEEIPIGRGSIDMLRFVVRYVLVKDRVLPKCQVGLLVFETSFAHKNVDALDIA